MPDGIYGWFRKGGFRSMLAAFGIAPMARTYPQLDEEVAATENAS
jgi:urea transport system permease protein